jgi:hypothetical protein
LAPIAYPRATRESDDEEETLVGFRSVSVFDVSQTHGRPIPKLAQAKGDGGAALDRLIRVAQGLGIMVQFIEQPHGRYGVSRNGVIELSPNLEPPEAASTLAHELGHELMHWQEDGGKLSPVVQELEAEAVAFVVCSHLGIQALDAAKDYTQMHQGTAQMLAASLSRISNCTRRIITALEMSEDQMESKLSESKLDQSSESAAKSVQSDPGTF